jgi:hypothetical protein
MKRASVLQCIMAMTISVLILAREIGGHSLVNRLLITSVEYTSLKEMVAIVRGISLEIGKVMVMIFITLLMIYLVNADQ